jgi:ElaB/YqjD/DUF883 family membrane-anchored ribosome-binding protein
MSTRDPRSAPPPSIFDDSADVSSGTFQGDESDSPSSKSERKADEMVSGVQNEAGEMAGKTEDKAKEMTGKAQDKAKEMTGKAEEVGGKAQDKADQGMDSAASGLGQAASKMREQGAQREGAVGTAAAKTADTLDSASQFLQNKDTAQLMDDVEAFVRQKPVESLLIAAGIGFVLSKIVR